ncbi:MAG: HlyD family efflux transporter periplasmic adaptor subunit [Pirellulales bacterium]
MASSVDLRQLAVDRKPRSTVEVQAPPRRWFSRYVLPLLLVAAFCGMLLWSVRASLLPAKPVSVVPVVVTRAEVRQTGTAMFQAAGWIEPSPAPVLASSLYEGMVDEVLVVGGQTVERGQIIATLIDADARIALGKAEADVALLESEVEAAQAELTSAEYALAHPLQLRADLGQAESMAAAVEAELAKMPAELEAAETHLAIAERNVQLTKRAGNAISGQVLREAEATLAAAKSTLEGLRQHQPVLNRQLVSLQDKRAAVAELLREQPESKRRLAAAKAGLKTANARLDRARRDVKTAQLNLQRCTVRSPITGRVLSVNAYPGRRLSGLNPHSEDGSSAVAALYDPRELQVRVDVRLEDVSQVVPGQPVEIETAAHGDKLLGKVISVTSLADIQKNTLQVKALLLDPPDVVRPEMLAQVTFLAPESPTSSDESESPRRLLVPRDLVRQAEGGDYLWIVDPVTRSAKWQSVQLGRAGTDQLVEVVRGLTPTDKLISRGAESLVNGDRLRVIRENYPSKTNAAATTSTTHQTASAAQE